MQGTFRKAASIIQTLSIKISKWKLEPEIGLGVTFCIFARIKHYIFNAMYMNKYFTIFFISILFVFAFGTSKAQPNMEYVVSNSNDAGAGSLRQAILDHNENIFPGTIKMSMSNYYIELKSPLPPLKDSYGMFVLTGNTSISIIATGSARFSDGLCYTSSDSINHTMTYLPLYSFNTPYTSIITHGFFLPKTFEVINTKPNGFGSLTRVVYEAELRKLSDHDSIKFNIPGSAPHLITLKGAINVNSRIVLDGSTQPANGYSGPSPKIELTTNDRANDGIVLNGDYPNLKSAYSEIYGLYMHGFRSAILYGDRNLTIGAPGKGNVLSDNYAGVGSYTISAAMVVQSEYTTIQNNIIGLDPLGAAMPNLTGIYVYTNHLTIQNNIICANTNGAINGGYYTGSISYSYLTIKGNNIGVGADGMQVFPNGAGINVNVSTSVTIGGPGNERNIISGNDGPAIYLGNVSFNHRMTDILITNNRIGTDLTGTIDLGNAGYAIALSADSIIATVGGATAAEGNIIAFNDGAINSYNANVFIQNNSIFGNDEAVMTSKPEVPAIVSRSFSEISGTSVPNAIIQLYEDDGMSAAAQGKTFVGEVSTDLNGEWLFTGAIQNPCDITAICLQSQYKRSSGFSPVGCGLTTSNTNALDSNIQASPNPFSDRIDVSRTSEVSGTYCISDVNGRIVLEGTLSDAIQKISTDVLPKGVYVLQLYTTGSDRISQKMIKQ